MMMPANFSAVAENEMTYVVGGSLVDVLAPAMTTANWQNVSANVIKIVGNAFLAKHTTNLLGEPVRWQLCSRRCDRLLY